MRRGFLGLGSFSGQDRAYAATFGVFLLAMECVLEGVLQSTPERWWIFHACTAGLAVWSLITAQPLSHVVVGVAGLATFANEIELVSQLSGRWQDVAPSGILLVCAIYALVQGLKSRSRLKDELELDGSELPIRSARLRASNPETYLLATGVVGSFAEMTVVPWVGYRALFGLIEGDLTLGELRGLYEELEIADFARVSYLEWGYMLTWFSLLACGALVVQGFVRSVSPPRIILLTITGTTAVSTAMQAALAGGLLIEDDVQMRLGPILAVIGGALATTGSGLLCREIADSLVEPPEQIVHDPF